jgi:anaerobic selenocysteine-containing dehydrogenase
MAIHSLNALVGSIDVPGGVTTFRELSVLDGGVETDEVAARGLTSPAIDGPRDRRPLAESAVDLLADAIERGRPYPLDAVVLADADPVFSLAEGSRLRAALAAVPFVVSFAGYHDNSNRWADVILPRMHGFHRWDYDVGHTLKGFPVVTLSQPVMAPPPGMLGPYEIIRALGQQMGGTMTQALPWADARDAVDAVCRELFEGGKGAAFGPANEESWAQLLESRGWRAPFAMQLGDFKRDLLAGGGWTDPIYFHREWDRVFRSSARIFWRRWITPHR